MRKFKILLLTTLLLPLFSISQYVNHELVIDSILGKGQPGAFNGAIMIQKGPRVLTMNTYGYSNFETKKAISIEDKFIIGSLSKQFTAAMVLLEVEKGVVNVNDPIDKYLTELDQEWASEVTIHNLLAHTHGITDVTQPLAFAPGTQFKYSQLGYQLLAKVLENINQFSFIDQSMSFFKDQGMNNTFHPKSKKYTQSIKGYVVIEDSLETVSKRASLMNYPAAGSFISTIEDLMIWNERLHSKLILSEFNYNLMVKTYNVRKHPLFGDTNYGYGICSSGNELEFGLGQAGYAPGFVSYMYYFPETKTTMVMLSNLVSSDTDLKDAFKYPIEIMKYIRSISTE